MNVVVFAICLTVFALGSSETNQKNKLLKQENSRLLDALKALTAKDVGVETAIGTRYTYERKTGYCRNDRGQDGSFSVINTSGLSDGGRVAKCENACNKDDKCVAFEVRKKEQQCQIHYDATQTLKPSNLPSAGNCAFMGGACNMNCWFKQAPQQGSTDAFYCYGRKLGDNCARYLRSMIITGETDPVKINKKKCGMKHMCFNGEM